MKIIHVAGRSGSGKTTFIKEFAPMLCKHGRVSTIKHLGHHSFTLQEGKDTTIHFSTGAEMTIGIDDEKMVAQIRSISLDQALRLLADQGMDYVIIEGFKKLPFTKILIGDLEGDAAFRNPSPETILDKLDLFDEYHTLQSLIAQESKRKVKRLHAGYQIRFKHGESCEDKEIISRLSSIGNSTENIRITTHIQKSFTEGETGSLLLVISGDEYGQILLCLMRAAGVIRECYTKNEGVFHLPSM